MGVKFAPKLGTRFLYTKSVKRRFWGEFQKNISLKIWQLGKIKVILQRNFRKPLKL